MIGHHLAKITVNRTVLRLHSQDDTSVHCLMLYQSTLKFVSKKAMTRLKITCMTEVAGRLAAWWAGATSLRQEWQVCKLRLIWRYFPTPKRHFLGTASLQISSYFVRCHHAPRIGNSQELNICQILSICVSCHPIW